MRGIAFVFVALTSVAVIPQPVSAQCFGPECDRQQSPPPGFVDQRPNFHPNTVNGQPYRSAPFDQGQFRPAPYQQGQQYAPAPQGRPPYQQQSQYPQQSPYQQMPYQPPGYQAQPRPPMGHPNTPPGVVTRSYRPPQTNGRIDVRPQTAKAPKVTRHAAYQQQPALHSRKTATQHGPAAGAGKVTISVAEYRDLQNQARELQRLMSMQGGGGAPNRGPVFPDVRAPAPGR